MVGLGWFLFGLGSVGGFVSLWLGLECCGWEVGVVFVWFGGVLAGCLVVFGWVVCCW